MTPQTPVGLPQILLIPDVARCAVRQTEWEGNLVVVIDWSLPRGMTTGDVFRRFPDTDRWAVEVLTPIFNDTRPRLQVVVDHDGVGICPRLRERLLPLVPPDESLEAFLIRKASEVGIKLSPIDGDETEGGKP